MARFAHPPGKPVKRSSIADLQAQWTDRFGQQAEPARRHRELATMSGRRWRSPRTDSSTSRL